MALTLLLAKRIGAALVVLLVISLVTFGLVALSPGSQIDALIGSNQRTPELVAALESRYHLDRSLPVQYWHWLIQAVQLDFGVSISVRTGESVTSLIADRWMLSIQLAGYALVLVLLVGIPAGLAAGGRRGSTLDRMVTLASTMGVSAPPMVISILLLYVFGVWLGWAPVFGVGTGVMDRLVHLTLPAVAMATLMSALVVRQTRAAAMGVVREDYVTFARSRGLGRRHILLHYVLRNASMPIVTSAGILMIVGITAAVFVEQVFALPGIGSLLLVSIQNKDLPVVQALSLVIGFSVVMINLIVDMAAIALDPRVREGIKQ